VKINAIMDTYRTDNVVYLPPRFRGDSDRIRRESQTPMRIRKGHRIGHLVLLETPSIEAAYFDHMETTPWRKKCNSHYCIRCSPKTAKKKTAYADLYCRVKCDCGNEKIVFTYNLHNGNTLSCGNCAFSHSLTKEEKEAGIRELRLNCRLWCCTSERFYQGMSPYPLDIAA
jgi:hypothetical protein